MSRRQDRFDLVVVDLRHLQALFGHRQLYDPEIRLIVDHGVHDACAKGAVDQYLHIGESLFELGKYARQNVNAGCFVRGDDQFAAGHALQFMNGVLGAAFQLQDLLGIIGEDLAGGCQGDLSSEPVEQGRVHFLFQLANLGAHGGLGAETHLRGFREALQPHDLQKSMKLIEVHRPIGHPPGPISKVTSKVTTGIPN